MNTLRWTLIALVVGLGCMLACKLDPSKIPPCDPSAGFPDPCAAAVRDAGPG